MKLSDIKPHLRPYSIVQRRKTTINHAFASALAPCDTYDDKRLRQAMSALGQQNVGDLRCVYCGDTAETWDHLVGLVKDGELDGYGHQIGNLVPCCRSCNSLKGNRDWRAFLRVAITNDSDRERVEQLLENHLRAFATEVDLSVVRGRNSDDWMRYAQLRQQIIELMGEADRIAERLRETIAKRGTSTGAESRESS